MERIYFPVCSDRSLVIGHSYATIIDRLNKSKKQAFMSFFQVIIPPLDQPYTYRVPPDLAHPPRVGQRVLVPLRRKSVTGFLWEPTAETDPGIEIKAVEQILDPDPLFPESLRSFLLWTARYYHYPLGRVLKTALPPGLTVSRQECWRITPRGIEALGPDSTTPGQTDSASFLDLRPRLAGRRVSFSRKKHWTPWRPGV